VDRGVLGRRVHRAGRLIRVLFPVAVLTSLDDPDRGSGCVFDRPGRHDPAAGAACVGVSSDDRSYDAARSGGSSRH
jgi:hypothetical protein